MISPLPGCPLDRISSCSKLIMPCLSRPEQPDPVAVCKNVHKFDGSVRVPSSTTIDLFSRCRPLGSLPAQISKPIPIFARSWKRSLRNPTVGSREGRIIVLSHEKYNPCPNEPHIKIHTYAPITVKCQRIFYCSCFRFFLSIRSHGFPGTVRRRRRVLFSGGDGSRLPLPPNFIR